jgi:hypothetical protein
LKDLDSLNEECFPARCEHHGLVHCFVGLGKYTQIEDTESL